MWGGGFHFNRLPTLDVHKVRDESERQSREAASDDFQFSACFFLRLALKRETRFPDGFLSTETVREEDEGAKIVDPFSVFFFLDCTFTEPYEDPGAISLILSFYTLRPNKIWVLFKRRLLPNMCHT